MSIEFTFRPIVQWPGETTRNRRRSPFGVTPGRTQTDLARELEHLRAKAIVIQAALDERDIRQDCMIRAGATTRHPGVIVSFTCPHGPLSYPCDTYLNMWCNIRAISLAMSALRAVDRYGVTKRGEQYKGWKALPAPEQMGPSTVQQAAAVLATFSGMTVGDILADADASSKAYKLACMKIHPDREGNAADFNAVQQAGDFLDAHHPKCVMVHG